MKTICNFCKELKTRKRLPGERKWRNENLRPWNGRMCPNCISAYKTKKWLLKQKKEIDYSQTGAMAYGRWGEVKAKQIFEKIGFEVTHGNYHGPDLIITKQGKKFLVEVKSVTKRKDNGLCVSRVKEKRHTDDLIVFVTSKNEFYIDFMKDHLTKCSKDGQRAVTNIYKSGAFVPI